MAPPGQDVDLSIVGNFAHIAESFERGKLYQQLAEQWKAKFLAGVSGDNFEERKRIFIGLVTDLSGVTRSPRPPERSIKETIDLFDSISEVYDYVYLENPNPNKGILQKLVLGARNIGLCRNDADQVRRFFRTLKNIEGLEDQELAERFLNTVGRYASSHGLTDEAEEGLQKKLLPAIQSNDPQVEILLRGGNIWGMHPGDFGAGDFIVHAYTLRITPAHINELLITLRGIPATDLARLEQNRLDGLTLAAPFGALRDFLHDQRPYAHEVIEAMVAYYDAGDNKQLLSVLGKTDPGYLGSEDRRAKLLDRSRYDTPTAERRADGNLQKETVKPIDVLRRLNENTKPIGDIPPVTSDEAFNKLLQRLVEDNDKTQLQKALDYASNKLITMMQKEEVGIEPNLILTFAFLDKKCFQTLQKLKYEDQAGAYKENWFASILRFQGLTASADNYSETDFQDFVARVKNSSSMEEAYGLVSGRILEHLYALVKIYKGKGREDTGFLWSGNTSHELIGLTELKPAQTEIGRRTANEEKRSRIEGFYHPGD